MDNKLYIFDLNDDVSDWWRHFNDMHFDINIKDVSQHFYKIFNEYGASVIIKNNKHMLGLEFSDENQKTLFLLKYG